MQSPRRRVIRASLLLLHPAISAFCSGPLQWISRSLFGLAPTSEASLASAGGRSWALVQKSLKRVQRYQGAGFISHSLPQSLQWQFEILPQVSELFSTCTCSLSSHVPLITSTVLKVSGSCTYLCSNLKATLCPAMLLLSPLSHPRHSLPTSAPARLLSCLSFRRADATPRQIPYQRLWTVDCK